MKTPNTSELLVEQVQTAERYRLLALTNECETLDEYRERLKAIIIGQ